MSYRYIHHYKTSIGNLNNSAIISLYICIDVQFSVVTDYLVLQVYEVFVAERSCLKN